VTPLRRRMLEDLQIRHYRPGTVQQYLHSVAEFAQHFRKSPDQLGPEHIPPVPVVLDPGETGRPLDLCPAAIALGYLRSRGASNVGRRNSRSHCASLRFARKPVFQCGSHRAANQRLREGFLRLRFYSETGSLQERNQATGR
jgi:Phage integrase, N-terminal SAM-like domain